MDGSVATNGRLGKRRVPVGGFSLLELLIVLSIMVGVAALVWPSLSRPLADSTAQQAGNQLRDQLSSCRRAAMLDAEPMLVRFEVGTSSLAWGNWTQLLDESAAMLHSESNPLTVWQLPSDIVVDDVRFRDGAGEPGTITNASPIDSDDVMTGTDTAMISETLPLEFASTEAAPDNFSATDVQRQYLPFLPDGQTRDTVIVLRDIDNGSRVEVELDAVTGMMRTLRLPKAPTQSQMPFNYQTAEQL